MRLSRFSFGTLALVAGSALAADATLESARRCLQVKDNLERLTCFDRAFAGASAPAGQASEPVQVVVPDAAPVVAARAPEASFGEESVKRKASERATPEGPSSITAKVTAVRETRKDLFRLTLDNGQVWQQMEMVNLFTVAVGDTVQIEKGSLGGYRMARTSNGRSAWVRVSRSQ